MKTDTLIADLIESGRCWLAQYFQDIGEVECDGYVQHIPDHWHVEIILDLDTSAIGDGPTFVAAAEAALKQARGGDA